MKKIIIVLVLLIPALVWGQRVHDFNPATKGQFDPVDYGAVADYNGSTGTDNTVAVQAALNAAGYFAYTNPYYYDITHSGGGVVNIPKGRFKIAGTLRYPAGITIRGAGISTELAFRPAVSDTLFVADLNKSSKYTGVYRTSEQVRFENFLATGDFNGNEGFWSVNAERLVFDNVTIEGFNTGIYIDGTGGEACYDVIRDCVIHDCVTNIYLGEGARVVTIIGGYFWHSLTFTGAKYNFNLKAQDVFIYGASIEGKVDSAQIYDDGAGVTLVGVYHENRGGSTAPFILKNFRQSSTYGTTILGMGNSMGDILFKNFPLIVSDDISTAYSLRMGNAFKMGDPKFLPIIDNGNLRSSDITLFPQIGAKNNGTVAYDSMRFRSHGSIKLKHDASASSDNGFYFQLDTTDLRAYLGARLYISMLVNTTATAPVTITAFGAGNTVSKFGGDYVDYGNDWSLYALDIPIKDYQEALTVYVYQTSSVNNDPTFVTCIQAFTDGVDIIPISRDVGGLLRIVPQAAPPGTAYEGMIYMDTDHHLYVHNGTTWVQLDN